MTRKDFKLDTSGEIFIPSGPYPFCAEVNATWLWTDLSPFEQGYVEGMFNDMPQGPSLLPRTGSNDLVAVGFSDLAPETLARIREDCEKACRSPYDGYEDGALFWRTRQLGTNHTLVWPPLTLYFSDDGKVYFR